MIDTDLVKAKNDEIIKIIQDAGELLLNYFHKINELTVERKQGEGLSVKPTVKQKSFYLKN